MKLSYHQIAFLAGFLLDLLLGDPHGMYHPVQLIGAWISWLEQRLYPAKRKLLSGGLLVFFVLLATGSVTAVIWYGCYKIHPYVGCVAEAWMTYRILAIKSLKTESRKVYDALNGQGLSEARKAVAMIVGRDTECLDEAGVIRAAVETVAENTSDGVIAPMFYLALAGPVGGFLYKAVNTMDSMIGYRNERYLYFGRVAARLDDVLNFIPARISAYGMIAVSFGMGKSYHARDAYRIYRRDRYQHKSPNSAQTEAACAGALGIRLAGDASYFGKIVKKPYIGDDTRPVEREDILRADRLLYATAFLAEVAALLLLACCGSGFL